MSERLKGRVEIEKHKNSNTYKFFMKIEQKRERKKRYYRKYLCSLYSFFAPETISYLYAIKIKT